MWPTVVLALALTQFDQRFALTWSVPCAPAPDVAALLGTAEGEAVVTVTEVDAVWRLEVTFVAPARGVRRLEAPTCEDAARAALLFLKLGATAQPDRTPVLVRPPEPEPEPEPEPPPPPPPPDVKAGPGLDVNLELGALVSAGALPAASPRLTATLGIGAGHWAGFLGVRAGVPGAFAAGPAAAQVSVHPALGAQLSGCYFARSRRARAGPCAAVTAEWWRVAGLKVDLPLTGSELWLAAGADARLLLNLTPRVFVVALVGVRFSLRRPQLVFEGFGPAYAVPLVAGEGALGLGWQW